MDRFINKIVLILGGNSGIGLASAKGFAAEGATVILTGRDQATLDAAALAIGHGAQAVQADIADLAATRQVVNDTAARHGRIDVLFVNAGVGAFVPIEQITEDKWDHIQGVNLKGPYFAIQAALPFMAPGTAIVLTSSIGHVKGISGNSVYAASKAGLRALARNLGAEFVDRGIRVNCVSPGPIDTPIINRTDGLPADQVEAVRANITANIPMKRFGTADEAANAVLFLASDQASFITGIDLFVDGGAVSF